ncbi:uncharacterized protein I303_102387 [Kwoniella dejecticola CBS 10117]|uniref:Aquaporin-like protein n=1 Tax=Kwoniella dejecticola CBS 10117 TaxID=1296121 RepID=A0AAJ8KLV1_9TREE
MNHQEVPTSLPQESPLSEAPTAKHEFKNFTRQLKQPSSPPWHKQLHVALIGEFVGTFLFLFFAYAGVMVGKTALGGTPSTTGQYLVFLLFGATSFGASPAINAWIFFRVSGGLFNPAVTTAFVLTGLMHPLKGLAICVIQLLAGIAAAGVVAALIPGELATANALGPDVSITQGLFMEMFLTAELILAIFMLAVEKHRVIERKFPGYHWIYWIGPLLGSLLASIFYKMLRVVEYYTANEGQDDDGLASKKV